MLNTIIIKLLTLRFDRRGASAIEYGLIAAGAALAIAAFVPGIKSNLEAIFTAVRAQLILVAPAAS